MKKLYLASIWAPGAIPAEEWKYRNLKRVMFPIVDLLFFIAGLTAATNGIRSVDTFFSNNSVTTFSYIMSIAALICLVGVSFPKYWGLEMFGKSILLGLMVGYISALIILTFSGHPLTSAFTFIIASIAICQIIWRVTLLGSEWQDRKLSHKVDVALLKAKAKKESNSG
jgi:hypothetical protein